ncbi:hypothetical protein GCM10009718_25810 [Isoptericola halotolerans]|uniref:Uncharacterized protein n=1 Tax=Isoptericola halotolerans TaxID=300560 RepID=A0ABX2A5D5_9MICO|nr:hypothetical protein [Isoptericola halotolerans]NOV97854.1 hypothetical protein [Isoptericola halotolerans]
MIGDIDEVLNRQVPPGLYDTAAGQPMWTAFRSQSADKGLMSTLRGRVAPQEAHRRHTEDHGRSSVGTWGVKVGDANEHGLACVDDGAAAENPHDHASVDFNGLTKAEARIAGMALHETACQHGPLYVPGQGVS